MIILRQFLVFALLAAFVGCSGGGRMLLPSQTVKVSQDVPDSLRNSVLNLKVRDPIDPMATNYDSWGSDRSLKSPVGFGSGPESFTGTNYDSYVNTTNILFHEERLIAIKAKGFEMLFIKRKNGIVQTNDVLFRYGETTETNIWEWKIIGTFK